MARTFIRADRNLCEGYANCSSNVPHLFGTDDEGLVVVLKSELDHPEEIEQAELAVNSCPMRALTLEIPGA
jgi:ferredoxin